MPVDIGPEYYDPETGYYSIDITGTPKYYTAEEDAIRRERLAAEASPEEGRPQDADVTFVHFEPLGRSGDFYIIDVDYGLVSLSPIDGDVEPLYGVPGTGEVGSSESNVVIIATKRWYGPILVRVKEGPAPSRTSLLGETRVHITQSLTLRSGTIDYEPTVVFAPKSEGIYLAQVVRSVPKDLESMTWEGHDEKYTVFVSLIEPDRP